MSLTVTTTFGRKQERTITVEVDAEHSITGWVERIGEKAALAILERAAYADIEAESKRIMARDPDLTEEEAQKHFDTLFQFNKDMAAVEKAAKLRAELAALGEV